MSSIWVAIAHLFPPLSWLSTPTILFFIIFLHHLKRTTASRSKYICFAFTAWGSWTGGEKRDLGSDAWAEVKWAEVTLQSKTLMSATSTWCVVAHQTWVAYTWVLDAGCVWILLKGHLQESCGNTSTSPQYSRWIWNHKMSMNCLGLAQKPASHCCWNKSCYAGRWKCQK